MNKLKTNKLSIYLIKKEYSLHKDILNDCESLEHENINKIGDIFYGKSQVRPSPWVEKFFGLKSDSLKIFNATAKAVFLVKVENRTFALTFGYGHTLLEPGVWEERFGLKVALSTINPENLRSIDKKNMSTAPKLSKEQMTKDGTFAEFGIDVEQDLIQGVTGKTKDEVFGKTKTITGQDALTLSIKVDVSNIEDFLIKCYESYKSNDYKKEFEWIDNISEIKSQKDINKLNHQLLKKINNKNFDKVWMAIPEIINWEDVSEFKLKKNSFGDDIDLQNSFGDDIDLPKYLEFLTDDTGQKPSLEILKKHKVNCINTSSNEVFKSWKIYNCLYCEIEEKNEVYILSNGKWYKIEAEFSKVVCNSFESFKKESPDIVLPQCEQDEHEDKYNQRVGNLDKDIYNLDRKMIYYGGANQKIEFCDLLTKNKEIIHVKHYGSSSVLSHLFNQGLVSGELLSDKSFRKKLHEELTKTEALDSIIPGVSEELKPSDYEIIFAIISKIDKELDIPFFSKVSIKNVKNRLIRLGYKVSLLKIETEKKSS